MTEKKELFQQIFISNILTHSLHGLYNESVVLGLHKVYA